ncbi:MAG: hypothetical protein QXN74_07890 [Saccharolobus sp.]
MEKVERKNEADVKAFIIIMTILMIIAAAITNGSYNGYDPKPSSVAITEFILIVTIAITAIWYRSKYPGYVRGR